MEVLWAPWRIEYILGPKPDHCVFCIPPSSEATPQNDAERLVLYRAKHCFVIMNKFPYTNGHLMITPYRHMMDLGDLKTDESHEIMDVIRHCSNILKACFKPHGLNVGLNVGEAAGAGIREHMHFHMVPRWNGDSSFMALSNETRVIPQHIDSTYSMLKPYFDRLTGV